MPEDPQQTDASDLRKVWFPLDPDAPNEPPGSAETMWALAVGADQYRLKPITARRPAPEAGSRWKRHHPPDGHSGLTGIALGYGSWRDKSRGPAGRIVR